MFVGRYRQFARLGLAVLVLAPAVARTQAPSEGKPRASNLPNPAARARPVAPTGGSADLNDTVALGAFMDGAMSRSTSCTSLQRSRWLSRMVASCSLGATGAPTTRAARQSIRRPASFASVRFRSCSPGPR